MPKETPSPKESQTFTVRFGSILEITAPGRWVVRRFVGDNNSVQANLIQGDRLNLMGSTIGPEQIKRVTGRWSRRQILEAIEREFDQHPYLSETRRQTIRDEFRTAPDVTRVLRRG